MPAIDGNIAVLKICEDRWRKNCNSMRGKASIMDVRSFIKKLEFQKESIQRLAEQAQRSTDLVNANISLTRLASTIS